MESSIMLLLLSSHRRNVAICMRCVMRIMARLSISMGMPLLSLDGWSAAICMQRMMVMARLSISMSMPLLLLTLDGWSAAICMRRMMMIIARLSMNMMLRLLLLLTLHW